MQTNEQIKTVIHERQETSSGASLVLLVKAVPGNLLLSLQAQAKPISTPGGPLLPWLREQMYFLFVFLLALPALLFCALVRSAILQCCGLHRPRDQKWSKLLGPGQVDPFSKLLPGQFCSLCITKMSKLSFIGFGCPSWKRA